MSLDFLLISLIVVASPGTGVIYTLAAGLARGSRASVLAAFACTLGIVPHLAAAMLGLAALLHTSALAYNLVKYAGVAYLLYMAWQSIREHGVLQVEKTATPRTALRVLLEGVLINILNPKLSIFFVAFLPQFIVADEPSPLLRMLELSAVFMVDDLRRVRDLRPVRRGHARSRDQPSGSDGLDAACVCRGLCRTRCKAGAYRTVSIGPSCPRLSRASTP